MQFVRRVTWTVVVEAGGGCWTPKDPRRHLAARVGDESDGMGPLYFRLARATWQVQVTATTVDGRPGPHNIQIQQGKIWFCPRMKLSSTRRENAMARVSIPGSIHRRSEHRPAPIEGFSTSTAVCRRDGAGPTHSVLVLAGRTLPSGFGGNVDRTLALRTFFSPYAVRGFFDKRRTTRIVARVVGPDLWRPSGDLELLSTL